MALSKKRMGRLKEPLVSYLLGSGKGSVKALPFFKWAASTRKPALHMSRRTWKPLREGKLVPWELIEAFVEYAGKPKREGGAPLVSPELLKHVEQVMGGARDEAGARVVDPWRGGWTGILAWVVAPFKPVGLDLCQNAEDVELAAALHIEWMGRYTAKDKVRVDKEEARLIGEREMRRTVGTWRDWLLPVWKKSPSSILFSTLDGIRVGVNLVIPLTKAGWQRFRAGKVFDLDLTTDEIEGPSQYLLILVVAEVHPSGFRSAARASWAQLTRLSWQIASLCTDVTKRQGRPVLVSIEGTPESKRRLEGTGFSPLGTQMAKDPRPLYEFSSASSRQSFRGMLNYQAMCGLIGAFQAMQKQETTASEDEQPTGEVSIGLPGPT